jgi:hypothetical protein
MGVRVESPYWAKTITILGLAILGLGTISCAHISKSHDVAPDAPGRLVVQVVDLLGTRRPTANVYLLEDPRITSEVVAQGHAGVWTDDNGLGNLGSWAPGAYTVRVRLIGFKPEVKKIRVKPGGADTVRVVMRERMSLM